ncbi:MAG TPA: glycosyl hydrolase, partial [bacterium]|nr:glycosyl hydrolase [bacterium]
MKESRKVVDFLNSLGANSAVSRRDEILSKTIECVKYLGIRWIRSGYESNVPVEDLLELHRQTGVVFSYGLLSGGNDINRLLEGGRALARNRALLAFEGPNEPNNWAVKYRGKIGGRDYSWIPVAELQRDLYMSVKNDPELKRYPVWNLSEGGAE